jgi:hypothetical protein
MKLFAILLPISGLSISADVIQRDKAVPCCFSLIAEGMVNGPVWKDAMGENGVGTDFPQSVYCIYNSTVTEANLARFPLQMANSPAKPIPHQQSYALHLQKMATYCTMDTPITSRVQAPGCRVMAATTSSLTTSRTPAAT